MIIKVIKMKLNQKNIEELKIRKKMEYIDYIVNNK